MACNVINRLIAEGPKAPRTAVIAVAPRFRDRAGNVAGVRVRP